MGSDTPTMDDTGRRLIRRGAAIVIGAIAGAIALAAVQPQGSLVLELVTLAAWGTATLVGATTMLVGYQRLPRPTVPAQRQMSDAEANFRYRAAIADAQRDAWRAHRDTVLAAEAERTRTRDYLALPEPARYQEWIVWQLSEDPAAESLPYPPPAYPPPPPKALPA